MKNTKIYVSHTWEVISTDPKRCAALPYSTEMQQISFKEAKKLAQMQNLDNSWIYWLSGMSEFNLR